MIAFAEPLSQLRRAVSSLLQHGLHSPTAPVVSQLQDLHPPAPPIALPPLPTHAPLPQIQPELLRPLLQIRAKRGNAPGLSGWTEGLLLPLLDDSPSFLALCGFIEDIACGRVDPESRARLLSCTLIAARKKNDGVRPIALSEVFVRLASLC